jgi:methyl-galactoside transport system substrate-binding protein
MERVIMRKINGFLIWIIIAAAMFIFLEGCINRNFFSRKGFKDGLPEIGAAAYDYGDTFISYMRSHMEKYAEGRAALNMNDSQNDQDRQLQQVDRMISMGVRALAVNLVNPSAAQSVIDKARNADLPVIFFNKEPEAQVLEGYRKAWYVGVESKEAGILQGQMIAKLWKDNASWDKNHDGVLSYVMLQGEPGHPDTEERTKYSIEELKKEGLKVMELASGNAMWDSVKARDMMDGWLAECGDDIEFIISNNDEMALGALQSLEKGGYLEAHKLIPTVGVDATPAAIEKIKLGQMAGSVLNNPEDQAKAVMDLSVNAAEGNTILQDTSWRMINKTIRIPFMAITRDNTDEAEMAYSKIQ